MINHVFLHLNRKSFLPNAIYEVGRTVQSLDDYIKFILKPFRHGMKLVFLILMEKRLGVQRLCWALLSAMKVQVQQKHWNMRPSWNRHICISKWNIVLGRFFLDLCILFLFCIYHTMDQEGFFLRAFNLIHNKINMIEVQRLN